MLYIYTENLFALNKIKNFIKISLGRQNRGPKAVEDSLLRGFQELGLAFEINFRQLPISLACVISGSQTLRWAVEQKKKGLIKKIIAGPNIVVFPRDHGAVIANPMVDVVVVPSEWVKQKYEQLAPELKGKIQVWPAGVRIPKQSLREKTWDFLIYNKIGQDQLFLNICRHLQGQNFKTKVFEYGKFRQADYFAALQRTKFEIYLSRSESQGLAMFEAWARGVPTLVWDRGYFELLGFRLQSPGVACPYLTVQTGLSFKDWHEFRKILPQFLRSPFSPRAYTEENFSDAVCARKYQNIIAQL